MDSLKLKRFARRLRRRQTDAEALLWYPLRNRNFFGLKFRRQHPIGPYIADFCCPEKELAVELDGGHHLINAFRDQKRTDFLHSQGYQVLRFWDHEVLLETDTVLETIRLALQDPHPGPLPGRERGKDGRWQTF